MRFVALEARGASPPLLLLPFDRSSIVCNCLNLSGRNIIGVHIPELQTCCSVARGWLVTVSDELDVQLLHLYTKVQIPLPRHSPSYEDIYQLIRPKDVAGDKFHYVKKLVLSTNPVDSLNDCVIAGICGFSGKLVFCRPGDKNWMSVDGHSNCTDVIFYKNKIYAVANSIVIICEVGLNREVTELYSQFSHPWDEEAEVYYLVESLEGALFYVVRYREWLIDIRDMGTRNMMRKKKYRTFKFHVFKLEQRRVNVCYWSRVDCLGNQVLFVGRNASFALSADDFPQFKGNCIYFTDDNVEAFASRPFGSGCHDVGFFSLQHGGIEPVLPNASYCETPPMWFQQK